MAKKITKTIFAMVLMFSVSMSFGQTINIDSNGNSLRDDVYIYFTNMGNLPKIGTISVGWHYANPVGWINKTIPIIIPLEGDMICVMGPLVPPIMLMEGKVTVDLPATNGKYSATKWWSGYGCSVAFTKNDFVFVGTAGPGGPGSDPY